MRANHQHWNPDSVDTTPTLFDLPPSSWETLPSVPVDTSEQAAQRMAPHAGRLVEQVYAYVKARGEFGATEAEIEHGLTLPGNTVRPRLWTLCGNAPAGQPKPRARIWMTDERREKRRVYRAL